ncbi:MAG: acyl-CoA thioesterase [Kiloniellales bacterium]
MIANRIDITVQWGDCDPADIVFYPNFFRWFDCGTTELFASVGIDLATLFKDHGVLGVPILDAGASFRRPSRFRDTIALESRIARWGKSSFRVEHSISNGGQETVTGHELRAWVARDPDHPSGMRALPVPDEVRRRFDGQS